jgi:environmental stress-induced protein Ves
MRSNSIVAASAPSIARVWKRSRTTCRRRRFKPTVETIRAADYREQRWKNDGGVTHEVAADAESPPAWRISVATIERSGPFSDFRGYDRTIVALEGNVTLTVDGATVHLNRYEPYEFRGESRVSCSVEARARDFNVMTMREECHHDVEIVHGQSRFVIDDDEMVFGYVLHGEARIHDATVRAGETAYLDSIESFDVVPADGGAVCLVRITPV